MNPTGTTKYTGYHCILRKNIKMYQESLKKMNYYQIEIYIILLDKINYNETLMKKLITRFFKYQNKALSKFLLKLVLYENNLNYESWQEYGYGNSRIIKERLGKTFDISFSFSLLGLILKKNKTD